MYSIRSKGAYMRVELKKEKTILHLFDAEATASITEATAISENDRPYQQPRELQAGPSSFLEDGNGLTEVAHIVALIHHSGSINGHHVGTCFRA